MRGRKRLRSPFKPTQNHSLEYTSDPKSISSAPRTQISPPLIISLRSRSSQLHPVVVFRIRVLPRPIEMTKSHPAKVNSACRPPKSGQSGIMPVFAILQAPQPVEAVLLPSCSPLTGRGGQSDVIEFGCLRMSKHAYSPWRQHTTAQTRASLVFYGYSERSTMHCLSCRLDAGRICS